MPEIILDSVPSYFGEDGKINKEEYLNQVAENTDKLVEDSENSVDDIQILKEDTSNDTEEIGK